jgi:hypothetical protein
VRESYGFRPYNRKEGWCCGVKLSESYEVLESVAVGMDPAVDGFAGVLIELVASGEGYAVVETAAGSGNRLLLFRSRSQELARSLFEAELRPH